MVGIILASHGEFANGIKQSAQMIMGEQADVVSCILLPSEGPEDIKAKLVEAVNSLSNPDEVLFLCDLWGGTPFNQASSLMDGHEDKWAIVTGLNLPMLVEALGARFMMESAQEIAKYILGVARDGVKVQPASLDQAVEAKTTQAKPQAAIKEGTVLGDGKIKIVLARIDTRLLHGQVATAWTKQTGPDRIIVVSDAVSNDDLRKKMIEQAAPPGVRSHVVPLKKMIEVAKDPRFGATKAMLLFETPQDALRAIEGGVPIDTLNLGSMAHTLGKVVLTKAVSMDKADVETFEKILSLGVKVDVRKVPADSPDNIESILNKARQEL